MTMEGEGSDPTVVIEAFAGIGGFSQALKLLGYNPIGVVGIDTAPESGRIMRQHVRHALWYDDIHKVQLGELQEIRRRFPKATRVILAGGWPRLNHSQLNAHRGGAEASSSRLLDELIRLREGLLQVSELDGLAPWSVAEFYENVVMDEEDYKVQTRKIGFEAVFLEAGEIGRCRRPRLYWIKGIPMIHGADLQLQKNFSPRDVGYQVTKVTIDTERPPLTWFLAQDAQKMAAEDEPFATFTRPIPRQSPPFAPAGLEQASEKAKARWKGDAFRVQPYQYEDKNLAIDRHGPRRLQPHEQLRMMGFTSNHLEAKSKLSNDVKGQLIGNSFSATAVARLLVGLVVTEAEVESRDVASLIWQCWHEMEERAQYDEQPWKVRFGSKAGSGTMVRSLRELVSGPMGSDPARLVDPRKWFTDEEVLAYLLTRATSHRGGEIRIHNGAPMALGSACRQSVDPSHWSWKVLLSYQWKEANQHINILETAAVLDVLRKLCRESKHHGKRYVLLIDNQTALSALAKGRSSARALQSPLRRIAAILVAGGVVLHAGWVKSKWNPADGPSRWAAKRRGNGA